MDQPEQPNPQRPPAPFVTGARIGAAADLTVLSLYGFDIDGSPDCPVAAVVLNMDMLRQLTGLLAGRFNELKQAQAEAQSRIVVPS